MFYLFGFGAIGIDLMGLDPRCCQKKGRAFDQVHVVSRYVLYVDPTA